MHEKICSHCQETHPLYKLDTFRRQNTSNPAFPAQTTQILLQIPPESREHNFRNQTATTSSPCIVPSQTSHQPPHRNGNCRRRLGLSPPRYSGRYVPYARRPPQPPQYHHTTCCSLAPWLIEFPRWKLTLDRQSPFAGCLKTRLIPTPLDHHPLYLTPLPRPASA